MDSTDNSDISNNLSSIDTDISMEEIDVSMDVFRDNLEKINEYMEIDKNDDEQLLDLLRKVEDRLDMKNDELKKM